MREANKFRVQPEIFSTDTKMEKHNSDKSKKKKKKDGRPLMTLSRFGRAEGRSVAAGWLPLLSAFAPLMRVTSASAAGHTAHADGGRVNVQRQ